jgi:hypothetical protein
MKNVTIVLDEKVARWARVRAAEQDTSLSRLIGEMLRLKMVEEENYLNAKEKYFSQPLGNLKKPGTKYPRREELHVR